MKILVLTSSFLAPTYNDKIISQVNYINKFQGMNAELFNDLPLHIIEEKIISKKYDCVFPAVVFDKHINGKDYSFNTALYNLLLYHNQDYIGSDVMVQLLMNDKALTSYRSGIGLPGSIITKRLWDNSKETALNTIKEIDYPVIVKPNTLSASMGITSDSIAYTNEQISNIVENQFSEYHVLSELWLEKYLDCAQEYTVSVTGNNSNLLVCPTMLLSKNKNKKFEIYSYNNKRLTSDKRSIDYQVVKDRQTYSKLVNISIELFKKFNLRDYCRFDYLMDDNNNLFLIDANTIPALGLNYLYEYYNNGEIRIEQILALLIIVFAKRKNLLLPEEFLADMPQKLVKILGF